MLKNNKIVAMKHITLVDKMIRQRTVYCAICKARILVGEYSDPHHADELLDEWLGRHKHEKE